MSSQAQVETQVLPPLLPLSEKLGKYRVMVETKRYITIERYNVYLTTNFTLKFMKEDQEEKQTLYQNSQTVYTKFDIESEFPPDLVNRHVSEESKALERLNGIIKNIKMLVEFAQANNLEIESAKEDP